jgi:hypothetical protein
MRLFLLTAGAFLLTAILLSSRREPISIQPLSETLINHNESSPARSLQSPDYRAALVASVAIADPQQRSSEVLALLTSWRDLDLSGLLSWYSEAPAGDLVQLQARHLILERLSELPPETALSLVKPIGNDLELALYERWAKTDPALAAELVSRSENPDQRLKEITVHWCNSEPYHAEEWLLTLPQSEAREAALSMARQSNIVLYAQGRWARLQPNSALRWAATLPPEPR